jgi:hypothetical protein
VQRCRNCGVPNTDDSQFCEECGQALVGPAQPAPEAPAAALVPPAPVPPPQRQLLVPPAQPSQPAQSSQFAGYDTLPPLPTSVTRANVPCIGDTKIALSEGEKLWRAYPLVHFRPFRRKARGTLYVTDSRVILHSRARKFSGRTSLLEELRIESVTGVGSHIDRGLGFFGTILLIIWTVSALVALFKINAAIGILMLVVTAIIVLISYYYGRLGLRLYTNKSTPGPISFGNSVEFSGGSGRSPSSE